MNLEEWRTRCDKKLELLLEKYSSNDAARALLESLLARLQHVNLNNLSSVMLDMHRIARFHAPEVLDLLPTTEQVIEFFGRDERAAKL